MWKIAACAVMVCALSAFTGGNVFAQDSLSVRKDTVVKKKTVSTLSKKKKRKRSLGKKKKKSVKAVPKKTIALTPPSNVKPTMTGAPGTVRSYFFPDKIGAEWTLRTIQLLVDKNNKIVRADTVFAISRVIDTARFSLQRLPLMVTSDTSYSPDGKGVRTESSYYVDDSIAMTIFNNSISSAENRIFLVAPIKLRNVWHEKYEDSIVTMIAGFGDSVITPMGRFENVMVTLTQEEFSDMRKYYAPGHGIIKTVFRSVGPGGTGLVIVTTEMIAFKKPE